MWALQVKYKNADNYIPLESYRNESWHNFPIRQALNRDVKTIELMCRTRYNTAWSIYFKVDIIEDQPKLRIKHVTMNSIIIDASEDANGILQYMSNNQSLIINLNIMTFVIFDRTLIQTHRACFI